MSTNADTLITLYLYVCRWKLKARNTIKAINKTSVQITQVMQVAQALKTIPTKNDDQYNWMLMQVVVSFEIIICENQTFYIMDIVSQLKDNGSPISVRITY